MTLFLGITELRSAMFNCMCVSFTSTLVVDRLEKKKFLLSSGLYGGVHVA